MFGNLAFGHGVSEADKAEMVGGGLVDYVFLGAKHMVTGYDHILFLIGVLFFLTRFSDIAKFITAFTVGHCITLIGATVLGVNANYYLIDAVIAISVMYKGFENLDGFKTYFNRDAPSLVVMVFVFGLIHGFGLSARLQQIALGNEHVILKILSFNIGVEIGQIAVLVVIFPIIRLLRGDSFAMFSRITNIGLIVAGLGLFCYQVHGYFTDDHAETHVPVEQDAHDHDHADDDPAHRHDDHGHDRGDNHQHDAQHDLDHESHHDHHDGGSMNEHRGGHADHGDHHHDHSMDSHHGPGQTQDSHGHAHGESVEHKGPVQHHDHGHDDHHHDHDDDHHDHGH